jgi:hypothetical protein
MPPTQPCLLLTRRTWTHGVPVTLCAACIRATATGWAAAFAPTAIPPLAELAPEASQKLVIGFIFD